MKPTLAVDNSRGRRRAAAGVRAQLLYDLEIIKDDLGITGSENDAWLERRIGAVWARFETYTSRILAVPPASFVDDWGEVASTMVHYTQPPAIDFAPLGSPFLRVTPVRSVDALERNGAPAEGIVPDGVRITEDGGQPRVIEAGATGSFATGVRFEPATGKLFSLGPEQQAHDVSRELVAGSVRITYTAGWDDIPADLYEALIGCLSVLWAQRTGQSAGIPGGGSISSIDVTDLGALTFGGSSFVDAALKRGGGAGVADPLLGPWVALLDYYYDARVNMGSPLIPTTALIP